MPILDHCEDEAVMEGGVIRRSPTSDLLDLPGMPGDTESNIVERNIKLSKLTGAHFHVQHISYEESIRLLREAQQEGVHISAEASPHHLALCNDEVPMLGTNGKMNPPLGTEADRQALRQAVIDGTVSVIATDHAPHAPREKAESILNAPFGIIGLETAFPICYTELVLGEGMPLADLIARMTTGPASIIGVPYGALSIGASADLAIIDLEAQYAVDIRHSCSKSLNSPFHQRQVNGRVIGTISRGAWAYQSEVFE